VGAQTLQLKCCVRSQPGVPPSPQQLTRTEAPCAARSPAAARMAAYRRISRCTPIRFVCKGTGGVRAGAERRTCYHQRRARTAPRRQHSGRATVRSRPTHATLQAREPRAPQQHPSVRPSTRTHARTHHTQPRTPHARTHVFEGADALQQRRLAGRVLQARLHLREGAQDAVHVHLHARQQLLEGAVLRANSGRASAWAGGCGGVGEGRSGSETGDGASIVSTMECCAMSGVVAVLTVE